MAFPEQWYRERFPEIFFTGHPTPFPALLLVFFFRRPYLNEEDIQLKKQNTGSGQEPYTFLSAVRILFSDSFFLAESLIFSIVMLQKMCYTIFSMYFS